MGRPVGTRKISIEDLKKLVEMTEEGSSRPDIADSVGVSKRRVWVYQKRFDLV